eukprot:16769-Heterococcus_DN1.PRE.7
MRAGNIVKIRIVEICVLLLVHKYPHKRMAKLESNTSSVRSTAVSQQIAVVGKQRQGASARVALTSSMKRSVC